MEIDQHPPLPPGIHVLEDKPVKPQDVYELFGQLSDACTPEERKVVDKVREAYAREHGLSFQKSTEE